MASIGVPCRYVHAVSRVDGRRQVLLVRRCWNAVCVQSPLARRARLILAAIIEHLVYTLLALGSDECAAGLGAVGLSQIGGTEREGDKAPAGYLC